MKENATAVPELGALVVPLDDSTASWVDQPRYNNGCIVAARLDTNASFEERLQPGDLIFGVNAKRVTDIGGLRDLLTKIPDGTPLVVQVQRDGILRYIMLRGE